jgi:hypothetical protein
VALGNPRLFAPIVEVDLRDAVSAMLLSSSARVKATAFRPGR